MKRCIDVPMFTKMYMTNKSKIQTFLDFRLQIIITGEHSNGKNEVEEGEKKMDIFQEEI